MEDESDFLFEAVDLSQDGGSLVNSFEFSIQQDSGALLAKKLHRMAKNRLSARKSREKMKAKLERMDALEERVKELEEEVVRMAEKERHLVERVEVLAKILGEAGSA